MYDNYSNDYSRADQATGPYPPVQNDGGAARRVAPPMTSAPPAPNPGIANGYATNDGRGGEPIPTNRGGASQNTGRTQLPFEPVRPVSSNPYGQSSDWRSATGSVPTYREGQDPTARTNRPQGNSNPDRSPKTRPSRTNFQFGQGAPLILRQSLNDLGHLTAGFLSGDPTRAYRYDLAPLTWSVLLFLSILFYGLTRALVMTRIFGSLALLAGINQGSVFGKEFLNALFGQLITLVVLLGGGFLMARVSKGESRPALQMIKTLAAATFPHTLLSFVLLLVSLVQPSLASTLLTVNTLALIYTFSIGVRKVYGGKRSVYWVVMLLFFVFSIFFAFLPGIQVSVL